MHSLLEDLLQTAENNTHVIQFTIDESQRHIIEAPFNMRITGDIGTAYVNARTRQEAIQIVLESGVPVKQFVELQ